MCEQFAKSKVRTRTRDLLIVQSSVLTVTPPGHTMSTMARSIIIIFIRLKISTSIQKNIRGRLPERHKHPSTLAALTTK